MHLKKRILDFQPSEEDVTGKDLAGSTRYTVLENGAIHEDTEWYGRRAAVTLGTVGERALTLLARRKRRRRPHGALVASPVPVEEVNFTVVMINAGVTLLAAAAGGCALHVTCCNRPAPEANDVEEDDAFSDAELIEPPPLPPPEQPPPAPAPIPAPKAVPKPAPKATPVAGHTGSWDPRSGHNELTSCKRLAPWAHARHVEVLADSRQKARTTTFC